MSLGQAPLSEDVFRSGSQYCRDRLSERSIYELLYQQSHRLFPDQDFADLFSDIGRHCVPPRIVAVVMVLQRLEGLSDREATERFTFDLRWKYAAGGLAYDAPGFVHTVLVDMRARLRRSQRPNRIFEAALSVAHEAGLIGRKRVLDSTPLYDAVATQDTVTLIRSAIRGLLAAADAPLAAQLRAQCRRDDDYRAPGKPLIDWQDEAAREALIDALSRDAYAVLLALDGQSLSPELTQAAQLLSTVVGQDIQADPDGVFRIVRGVAKERVVSTVDPETRHGHKTAARSFDGYKGHIAVDPDSEIITATEVTAGNAADGSVAAALCPDVFAQAQAEKESAAQSRSTSPGDEAQSSDSSMEKPSEPLSVYGDAAYGTAEFVQKLEQAQVQVNVKVALPSAPSGKYGKDDFCIDLEKRTVRCPAGVLVVIKDSAEGGGIASFGAACASCPLRSQCTDGKRGRHIRIHKEEATLQRHRQAQKSPTWKASYRATRPKVERKLGHLMQRRHGGRRARMRGRERVGQDFAMLGAAHNLKRMATLGLGYQNGRWVC
jgi:hypothetical protein